MNQKNKYLTIDTHSRASKWHMGYGSVLLRLGGVRSQSPNRLQKYYIRDCIGDEEFNNSKLNLWLEEVYLPL